MKRVGILMILLISASAVRARIISDGISVAAAPNFKETSFRAAGGESGIFTLTGTLGEVEVSIRGTHLEDPTQAKSFSKVDFVNVTNLYEQKRSPYVGQISQIVDCDLRFKARVGNLRMIGEKWRSISGGANARKALGACRKEDIAYWARYFNVVDESSGWVIAVRLFAKLKSPSEIQIRKIEKSFDTVAKGLIRKERG